ncbi:MAG: hypothetical protein ABSG97_03890 [Sedimentisphaerales bacterium]|jgi:hypothetical protein
MKRFLFVFLVLGWTISAYAQPSADVFVFDMKASNAGFGYVADTNTWTQIKDANTAFLIVELPIDGNTANIHAVYTWKGKDKKNYAMDVNMGRAFTGGATLGSKEISFIIDANANTPTQTRTQMSGNNKLVTIGKKTNRSCLGCHTAGELTTLGNLDANCPPSLTGYQIKIKTYANGNKKLCTSTLSLKLDIAKTLATHPDVVTAEDEASTLLSGLYDAGYTIVEP